MSAPFRPRCASSVKRGSDSRSGRPTMRLTGGALRQLQAMLPPGHEARIDVSLTDEGPMAQAIVIISAIPIIAVENSR